MHARKLGSPSRGKLVEPNRHSTAQENSLRDSLEVDSTAASSAQFDSGRAVSGTANSGTAKSDTLTTGSLPSAGAGISSGSGTSASGESPDVTSRFLQYLRDWEEKFSKQGGSTRGAGPGSGSSQAPEVSVPGFEPSAPELQTTWSSYASTICCLNTYPNGITFSHHNNIPLNAEAGKQGRLQGEGESEEEGNASAERRYSPDQFHLRFRDTRDLRTPAGRYHLHRENAPRALEQHLAQLHRSGKLGETVLYFGTMTDPFLSLHKKFDVTMGCLDVIERYAPGRVVFQTRSPMVISVLPALKKLGSRAVVAIAIETNSEKAVLRYTPGMPRIAERLLAADGLRKQGVMVNLQVSPILPYGDFLRDAWDFSELLERHADFVTFGSLSSGNPAEERFLRSMPIAQKLSADGMFAWLRPYAYQAVYHAMSVLAREKLLLPVLKPTTPKQLKLFAA